MPAHPEKPTFEFAVCAEHKARIDGGEQWNTEGVSAIVMNG